LVSEETVCEIAASLFEIEMQSIEDIEGKSIADFLWYDCADTKSKHHGVEKIRKFVEQLYQTPSGDIFVALFLNIDALTMNAHNALLKVFEDVPQKLLILVTSQVPEKIIPTLQSRIVTIDTEGILRGENPFQGEIDAFVA
jgi:DNA polymerase III delta prime subunit